MSASSHEFLSYGKIPCLMSGYCITEKIDGTNAQVYITEEGTVHAGSRNRWITPSDDDFDFAKWVEAKADVLRELLGPGRHYGEWWGKGIRRGYDLDDRRFSLFNVGRWWDTDLPLEEHGITVVPVIDKQDIDDMSMYYRATEARYALLDSGSYAAPGYMNPEGIMAYHTRSGHLFKYPFEPAPKSKSVKA